MKNVKRLANLEKESKFVLDVKDVDTQDVSIISTLDKKNDNSLESNYQGYVIEFTEDKVRTCISAGLLLTVAEDEGVDAFDVHEDGHDLVTFRLGIVKGVPTFREME